MIGTIVGSWKRLALHGLAALFFGLATLAWPHVTLWALVVLWGSFALVDGVFALGAAVADGRVAHRGWLAFRGLTGIAAGIVTFVWPAITGLALLVVIAAWAFVVGGTLIGIAVTGPISRPNKWLTGLGGALSVLLGVLLLTRPAAGALAITWAIGWYACLFGGITLQLAWTVRRETKAAEVDLGLRDGSHRRRLHAA